MNGIEFDFSINHQITCREVTLDTSLPFLQIELRNFDDLGKGGHKGWTIVPLPTKVMKVIRPRYNDTQGILPSPAAPIRIIPLEWTPGNFISNTKASALLVSEKPDELMLLRLVYG